MSVAHEFGQVYQSMMRELPFFGKFSPIPKDMEIFTVPRIVGRVKRSQLVFIP